MSGFDFTSLIEKAAKQEFYYIEVTAQSLLFLIRQGRGNIAEKINNVLEDFEGKKVIKLVKMGDLSVKENLGFRNDRFNDARRKELIAAIGEAKQCSLANAEKTFVNQAEWVKLPDELQEKLNSFFTAALAESTETSLAARQVTTVIQQRLIKDWKLEWTLEIPASLSEQFLAYFEGESTGWKTQEEEDFITINPESEGKIGLISTGTVPSP